MKIEFDTMTATFNDAAGLAALLISRYGAEVVPASYERVGMVERATGPVVINRYEAPAPDGYPTKPTDAEPINPHEDAVGLDPAPDRDSAGIPWDERIHASTKTTTANGTWTRRRNTPDELFNSVMAELRAANTARTVEAAASLTAPSVPVVPAPPVAAPEPTAAEAFTPPASVVIPPAVPAPPVSEAVPTFLQIMQTVTAAQREGKLDKAKLDELLASCNLDGVAKLVSADEGTRSAFSALLSAHLA